MFFVKGVVSFIEISREIASLITDEHRHGVRYDSLIEKLIRATSKGTEEVRRQLLGTHSSPDNYFMLAVFSVDGEKLEEQNTLIRADSMERLSKKLLKQIQPVFTQTGMVPVYKANLETVDYLLYAEKPEELRSIAKALKNAWQQTYFDCGSYRIKLSFSDLLEDISGFLDGLNQAYFTGNLMRSSIIAGECKSFSEIGSYQLLFYTDNKEKLLSFRDQYLRDLYEADREGASCLMDTLRQYLLSFGNLSYTAKQLFIHRNTLQYRLDRIAAITEKDLREYQIKHDFMNALMILDVFPYTD